MWEKRESRLTQKCVWTLLKKRPLVKRKAFLQRRYIFQTMFSIVLPPNNRQEKRGNAQEERLEWSAASQRKSESEVSNYRLDALAYTFFPLSISRDTIFSFRLEKKDLTDGRRRRPWKPPNLWQAGPTGHNDTGWMDAVRGFPFKKIKCICFLSLSLSPLTHFSICSALDSLLDIT